GRRSAGARGPPVADPLPLRRSPGRARLQPPDGPRPAAAGHGAAAAPGHGHDRRRRDLPGGRVLLVRDRKRLTPPRSSEKTPGGHERAGGLRLKGQTVCYRLVSGRLHLGHFLIGPSRANPRGTIRATEAPTGGRTLWSLSNAPAGSLRAPGA